MCEDEDVNEAPSPKTGPQSKPVEQKQPAQGMWDNFEMTAEDFQRTINQELNEINGTQTQYQSAHPFLDDMKQIDKRAVQSTTRRKVKRRTKNQGTVEDTIEHSNTNTPQPAQTTKASSRESTPFTGKRTKRIRKHVTQEQRAQEFMNTLNQTTGGSQNVNNLLDMVLKLP